MNKKRIFSIIILTMLFSILIKADVPPDFGETRVNPPLVFELAEDFANYKFFLESPINIEEIQIQRNEVKTIDNTNRGGAKKFVNLLAIPQLELDKLKFDNSESSRKLLKQKIDSKEIGGIILLVKHSFQQDIPISERAKWTYPNYKIERDGDSLKAITIREISPKLSLQEEKDLNGDKFKIVMIIVGIMLTLTVITFGIVLIRKVLKKG